METKICKTCRENKLICEYSKRTSSTDGLMNDCKKCRSIKEKKYRELNSEKNKNRRKKYYEENKDKHKKYFLMKRNSDPVFKLTDNMRRRLNFFLKKTEVQKNDKTFNIVGCSPDFLKQYLQDKFTEGMSWENYGYHGWHIDHIIPLCSAKTEEEILKLCHYSNLQPLWGSDNLRKGGKVVN